MALKGASDSGKSKPGRSQQFSEPDSSGHGAKFAGPQKGLSGKQEAKPLFNPGGGSSGGGNRLLWLILGGLLLLALCCLLTLAAAWFYGDTVIDWLRFMQ